MNKSYDTHWDNSIALFAVFIFKNKDIIEHLNEKISIQTFASILMVTERTIYNNIKVLNDCFEKYNIPFRILRVGKFFQIIKID